MHSSAMGFFKSAKDKQEEMEKYVKESESILKKMEAETSKIDIDKTTAKKVR